MIINNCDMKNGTNENLQNQCGSSKGFIMWKEIFVTFTASLVSIIY